MIDIHEFRTMLVEAGFECSNVRNGQGGDFFMVKVSNMGEFRMYDDGGMGLPSDYLFDATPESIRFLRIYMDWMEAELW